MGHVDTRKKKTAVSISEGRCCHTPPRRGARWHCGGFGPKSKKTNLILRVWLATKIVTSSQRKSCVKTDHLHVKVCDSKLTYPFNPHHICNVNKQDTFWWWCKPKWKEIERFSLCLEDGSLEWYSFNSNKMGHELSIFLQLWRSPLDTLQAFMQWGQHIKCFGQ